MMMDEKDCLPLHLRAIAIGQCGDGDDQDDTDGDDDAGVKRVNSIFCFCTTLSSRIV